MQRNLVLFFSILVITLAMCVAASAQVSRPYHDGSVWQISYIQMKPGMETAYKNYLTGDWKKENEALKKDGQIVSYMVIETEGHSATDFNLMLMVEYKDLATMEANASKADSLAQTVIGNDAAQMQGYRDRLQIREVLGVRLARQIILEPKK